MEEAGCLNVVVNCDASQMKDELSEIEGFARSISRLLSKTIAKTEKMKDVGALTQDDTLQELRRFVARVCREEDATPAELEAMAKVAPLALNSTATPSH